MGCADKSVLRDSATWRSGWYGLSNPEALCMQCGLPKATFETMIWNCPNANTASEFEWKVEADHQRDSISKCAIEW